MADQPTHGSTPDRQPATAGSGDGGHRPLVVVMGVSGSGKSTVGIALADRLGLPYKDADDFHPQATIDKMAAGHPLNDDDRAPWLKAIGAWLAEHDGAGAVASCSALKHRYRETLLAAAPQIHFLHLSGAADVISERMKHRPEHFMKASMLQSQIETLEPLTDDEPGIAIDVSRSVDEIVDEFVRYLDALRG
jgi:gluconokinase